MNINKLPKFMPGQVIDLSYKYKGLPNRILIKYVYIKEHCTQWMYNVHLENLNKDTILSESFIINNSINSNLKIYKHADIIKLYNDGWRFCGNREREDAKKIASKYATSNYINNVILRPAINYEGCLVNGSYGIWIKYNTTINNDGTIYDNCGCDDVIIIK